MRRLKRFFGWAVLILACAFLFGSAFAQPQQVSGGAHFEFEGRGTGNGTIAGLEIYFVKDLKWNFKAVNDLTLTFDQKGYLNRPGPAVRNHARLRYYIPEQETRFFVSGGFNLSGVQYADQSATVKDGYFKGAFQPTAGFGLDMSPNSKIFTAVIHYDFNFKAGLHARHSLTDSAGSVLDGWAWGQAFGGEMTFPINKTKWHVMVNAGFERSNYQRNKDVYGPQLGGEIHKFNVGKLGVGVGRKY